MGNALATLDEPMRGTSFTRASVLGIDPDGLVRVELPAGTVVACEVLQSAVARLGAGDSVFVLMSNDAKPGVVFGRIGPYVSAPAARRLELAATESLSLRCGESSIDLHADGKVIIRGEDVLVRAKGTKRIRAGTVSIN